jgi:hypothetical protein
MTASQRAEQWITRLAWIGNHDDPSKVASEAASLLRELLDERDELRAALTAMVDDLEARWDMRDPRTNPGIVDCVTQAKATLRLGSESFSSGTAKNGATVQNGTTSRRRARAVHRKG